MPASHTLDRLAVTFDDDHAVADAGLVLAASLAQHLGLRELFDSHVDLGDAPGHANVGHKAMTLIHSALADGDSIDDADALRAGATSAVLGHVVLAPSTLSTFLRSFTWGHARQLDVVSGRLLARAWAAGAGGGEGCQAMIDVDSSIVETYGLAKQGAKFTYSHVRGYHPLFAVMAGTGDVVHARLRGGNAHSGRGAASFLTETFARVRSAGASGPLVLRADSGFYNPPSPLPSPRPTSTTTRSPRRPSTKRLRPNPSSDLFSKSEASALSSHHECCARYHYGAGWFSNLLVGPRWTGQRSLLTG